MSDTIEPALSATEWGVLLATGGVWAPSPVQGGLRVTIGDEGDLVVDNPSDRDSLCSISRAAAPMVIAALNFQMADDDPRKITRATLELLREVDCCPYHRDSVRALADALESYLPPT